MEKLTVFYLETCPYCKNARRAFAELYAEDASLRDVPVEWINEAEQTALADTYDYYAVPSVFLGHEKLYEAHLFEPFEECKENIRRSLERARG